MIDILLEILISLAIVVSVFMIVILWRLFFILDDIKSIASVVSKRVNELDENVEQLKKHISDGIEAIKNFLFSLEFIKKIAKTIQGKKGE